MPDPAWIAEYYTARKAWDRGDKKPLMDLAIRKSLGVLNALESHLGCVLCRGPLSEGRCATCQGEDYVDY